MDNYFVKKIAAAQAARCAAKDAESYLEVERLTADIKNYREMGKDHNDLLNGDGPLGV
jgi:hypothetical protein